LERAILTLLRITSQKSLTVAESLDSFWIICGGTPVHAATATRRVGGENA
jgi:hypothetical protein